jgi:hypothetical protein
MFLNKIRETVDALKYKAPQSNIQDQMEKYHTELNEKIFDNVAKNVVNLGVRLIVAITGSWLILTVIHTTTSVDYKLLGVGGIAVSYAFSQIHGFLFERIQQMPMHKLNPYFGNKIEETILAFKK